MTPNAQKFFEKKGFKEKFEVFGKLFGVKSFRKCYLLRIKYYKLYVHHTSAFEEVPRSLENILLLLTTTHAPAISHTEADFL